MLELSQDVGHRLRVHDLSAQGVQVYIRSNDLYGTQFQCRLPVKTQLPGEIAGAGFRAFKERYQWGRKVRAVCVRAINLVPNAATSAEPAEVLTILSSEKLLAAKRKVDILSSSYPKNVININSPQEGQINAHHIKKTTWIWRAAPCY